MRLFTWILIILAAVAAAPVWAQDGPREIPLASGGETGKPAVKILDQHAGGLTIELQIPSLEATDLELGGRAFKELAIPEGGFAGDIGRAALPTYTRLVALPAGLGARVTLTGTEMSALPAMDLAPAQPVVDQRDSQAAAKLDGAWYARAPRTEPTVTIGEPALIRGQRVVPVTFSPLSYDPRTGELAAARTMTVDIAFGGRDARNNAGVPRPIPASFATMFEDAIVGWQRDENVVAGPGSYLMICPNDPAVLAAVQPLAAWRARQGYNTVVATTAQAGTTAPAIKAYIQAQYNTLNPPLEFVTLVGDANGAVSLPCWFENLSGYGGEGDLDYALLEGADVLVDVHLGRVSVSSVAELQIAVSKIVSYESTPDLTQTNWFTTAGLTGDPSSSGYSCVWVNQFVKESLQHLGYTRIDTIWSGNFVSQMMATINQGETLFTYRGYLNMSGMADSHIMALTNSRRLPFAVIMTCGTGSFSADANARSEAFLRAPSGGGIAAVGTATWGTHTRYNNCIFLGVTHGVLNTGEYRVGPALTRGKLNLYTNYIVNEPQQVQVWSHWNNLMGDPATEIWTGVPAVLTVTHPANLSTSANAIPVTVIRAGQPLAGALVAAYQAGTVRATGFTDSNGAVVLPIDGATTGVLQVTVTGHNLKPYLGATSIGAVTSSLDFAALLLNDSGGNGNGLANPGEPLQLSVQLANHGSTALADVTATLSSPLPWVHVNTATRSFGTVVGGGTAWSQGAFGVSLGLDAPGGVTAPLRLVATSGAQTWTSLVDLAVTGPRGVLNRAFFGGPGGTMDPGESGAITIDLANGGNVATAGVTATLSCNSNWVTVTDANGAFGAIPIGGQVTQSNPFAVSIAGDCYPGHLANFIVNLQYAEGGTGTVEFSFLVGTAVVGDPTGPDAYGYYIFDNDDPDPNAPVYNWQDISLNGQNTGIADSGTWDDDVRTLDLPFAFTMYGQSFTKVSICSNGWLALGQTYQRLYRNWHLPSDGGPGNMICAFWDDLAGGAVHTYHDTVHHRYIVQWTAFGTDNGSSYSGNETFQIILYDPAYHATVTGDGPIEIQYESVYIYGDETNYFTTGLQNGDRTTGVTYAYGNQYAGGAASLATGRALRIVPIVPQAQGILRGQVTNASAGGAPIPGAMVTVIGAGRQLATAADGHYEGNAPVGTWDVSVYHPSCAPDTTRDVVVLEGVATVVNFSLADVRGPAFAGTTALGNTVDTAGPYVVESTITDLTGVAERRLYYTSSMNGGPFEAPLTVIDAVTGLVRGEIPGQPSGSRVQYWLTASDVVGNESADPFGAPWPTYVFQVAQPTVLVTDDLETDTGWLVNVEGTDTATTGLWTRVDPNTVVSSSDASTVVPGEDHTVAPGVLCWITGQDEEGAVQGGQDVDGGATTLYTPVYDLSARDGATVSYWRWYTNDTGNNPGQDTWRVQATDDGTTWVDLETTMESQRAWVQKSFALGDYIDLTANVRLRFIAEDAGGGSLVEALVDDLRLEAAPVLDDLAAPTVTVTFPNGGQQFDIGQDVAVAWNAQDDIGVVQARISFVVGGTEHFVAEGAFHNSYTFVWNDHFAGQPGLATGRFRVVVLDGAQHQAVDTADADVTFDIASGVVDALPTAVVLAQNHPNPFNPRTTIRFALPRAQDVTLRIFDVQGKLVRTLIEGPQTAGAHEAVWEGRDDRGGQVPSGTYLYRLRSGDGDETRKMLLLK
jgi:hypothetical protein